MASTKAARLDAVLEEVAPKAMAYNRETGRWPQRQDDPRPVRFEREVKPGVWEIDKKLTEADVNEDPKKGDPVRRVERGKAPYEFTDLADGSRRLQVFAEDGAVYSGNGATTEAAVADVSKKLGLAQDKKG